MGLVVYAYLYQLTKPSALSIADAREQATAAGYMIVLGISLALLGFLLAFAIDVAAARIGANVPGVGTRLVGGIAYAVAVMFFVENLLYSATGEGLKTQEGPALNVVYVVLGFSVGFLGSQRTMLLSDQNVRRILSSVLVLAAVGFGLVIADHVDGPANPTVSGHIRNRLNVIILSSDGVDAGHMSVYGYGRPTTPFLDAKASEFSVFENAFTNNGNTTGSIVSMLNGISPLKTDVVYPPDALTARYATRTLPYLLGKLGYLRENWAVPHYADAHDQNLVAAFDDDNGHGQDHTLIQSLPLGSGVARWLVDDTIRSSAGVFLDSIGVEHLQNPYAAVSSHVTGDTLGDDERLGHVLSSIRSSRPVFENVHFMVTHGPAFNLPSRTFSHGEQTTPWQTDFYDDAILAFDKHVRSVYEALARAGELDRTLLVVTSDHGAEYDATKRIPLLIRFPRSAHAERIETNVERLDIAPTVLTAIGLTVPNWMSGRDLSRPELIPLDREIVATSAAKREFSNNLGLRSRNAGVTITTIRCRSYVSVGADGKVGRGQISGSTATCNDLPVTTGGASTMSAP